MDTDIQFKTHFFGNGTKLASRACDTNGIRKFYRF